MPTLSIARLVAAVAAFTAVLVGLDDLFVALGASAVLRDMAYTGILAMALALWPAWFTRVLPLLIARKKLLDDPVAQQRVTRLLRDVLEGAEGRGQWIKQPQVLILFFGKTLFGALGLPLTLLLLLVYLAIVRRNEFDADRRGALMVGADVMKQTLARFKAVHGESAWMDRPWLTLLSTHPGFGRRIRALDGDLHGSERRGDGQA